MKKYELIHEVFDMCSGKPESSIKDVETDDLDAYMKENTSRAATIEKTVKDNGSVSYEVLTNGQKEVYTFTADE